MTKNDTKIYLKMKNKSLLSIEKKYYKMKKKPLIIIIRNYYRKNNDLESSFDEEYKDVLKKSTFKL